MGGVVLHYQMQLKMLGRFSINFLEKRQPFLKTVM